MKKSTLVIFCLLATNPSRAETLTTYVHKVLQPTSHDSSALVLAEADGRVYHLKNESLRALLESAVASDLPVTLTLSHRQMVVDAKIEHATNRKGFSLIRSSANVAVSPTTPAYEASILEDDPALFKSIYKKISKPIRFSVTSQCYRRAHNWAYEMYQMFQIKSMKAFLFFTEKHIREQKYKWWFHVAPFVYVKSAEKKPKEMVIERSYYTSGPIEMNDWAAIFVGEALTCPEVKSYQEYESLQETKDCVIRKVPMYYYQPDQVSALDKKDVVLNDFVRDELIDMGTQLRNPHYIP